MRTAKNELPTAILKLFAARPRKLISLFVGWLMTFS
jgi:hypothetical protein